MGEETKRSNRWSFWKNGCIGCGGLAILGIVLLVIAVVRSNVAPEWKRTVDTQALPLPTQAPLEITLDLQEGDFSIEPVPSGEPLRVEANYNTSLFELHRKYDEALNHFRLSFESKPLIVTIDSEGSESTYVRLFVPRGYPVRLNGTLKMGASRLELGGLAIEDVDLKLSTGDHTVSFAEETSTTGKSIAIEAAMGDFKVVGLGNASPAMARIRHSAGEATIDLTGNWRQDADIDIGYRMGQCTVTAPGPEVGFVVDGSSVIAGSIDSNVEDRPASAGAPTVHLRSSGAAGSIEIR